MRNEWEAPQPQVIQLPDCRSLRATCSITPYSAPPAWAPSLASEASVLRPSTVLDCLHGSVGEPSNWAGGDLSSAELPLQV